MQARRSAWPLVIGSAGDAALADMTVHAIATFVFGRYSRGDRAVGPARGQRW